ncbi:MAG: class I tRNA ligase family protein, partial [Saprospiraceae bacterium]|nr:class I tRNA ligase family protein [Saprospiraceae bacterium]
QKKMVSALKESGQLEKTEPYTHSVGRSERTNVVVEPRLSLQWYVRMAELARPARDAVEDDVIEFFPKNQKNTFRHWMDTIRDWCISRQLWWGHRIPAYYFEGETFVAVTAVEALAQARTKTGRQDLTLADLTQDEDVLDTWFSSWLWPFSVFDGMDSNPDVDYYYPTSVLVTGWDIIFLWVARMAMSGFQWKKERPFKHVYFHGMVRDQQRRKMSKSLGNSPDALKLLDQFGADGVRFGILSSAPAGGDLLFDEKLCEQGRNFCNKIWNALRLIKGWEQNLNMTAESTPAELKAIEWAEAKTQVLLETIAGDFDSYRLSDIQMKIYSFIWSDFCSWYLEWIKPGKDEPLSKATYDRTIDLFSTLMQVLHPFMPFITEEVWHELNGENRGDCMVSPFPASTPYDEEILETMEHLKEVIAKTRDLRNKNNLKPREALPMYMLQSKRAVRVLADPGYLGLLQKSASLNSVSIVEIVPDQSNDENLLSFVVGTDKYYLSSPKIIDVAEELKTLKEDLVYQEGFVKSIRKKLDNDRFVSNAPEAVVDKERQKLADGEKRIEMLKESLARLVN